MTPQRPAREVSDLIPRGEYRELRRRGITLDTARKFRYSVSEFKGRPVQVATYVDQETGEEVAQKIRFPDKTFTIRGDASRMGLYGQHLWTPGGKMVVVTEGEIDALTVSQLQDNKWPVVSIPNGADAAKKALAKAQDWLLTFETIVLCFDNDEAGRRAAEECAPLFPPGRCKIAHLPLKDANEMLLAGRGEEVRRALWNAKPYRPQGVVTLEDVYEEAIKPVELGLPWPWPTLTEATKGRRRGEIYCLGAGTGIGKTDLWTQVAAYTRTELGLPVGVIYLEQPPRETVNRLAGKIAGRTFHIPDAGWSEDERISAINRLRDMGGVYMLNHFGGADWEDIKNRIRWMVVSEGVKDIFLDHLTALAAGSDKSEREALEEIMAEIGAMTQELDFTLYLISHLATPEGKPHEEGGRVMIRHFKGSRSIGFWCYFMFALERDQQEPDPEKKHISVFRILKDRLTGQAAGVTFGLRYDAATGLLHECELPSAEKDGRDYGFKNEAAVIDEDGFEF